MISLEISCNHSLSSCLEVSQRAAPQLDKQLLPVDLEQLIESQSGRPVSSPKHHESVLTRGATLKCLDVWRQLGLCLCHCQSRPLAEPLETAANGGCKTVSLALLPYLVETLPIKNVRTAGSPSFAQRSKRDAAREMVKVLHSTTSYIHGQSAPIAHQNLVFFLVSRQRDSKAVFGDDSRLGLAEYLLSS